MSADDDAINIAVQAMIAAVYDAKGIPAGFVFQQMVEGYADVFMQAVQEGMVDFDTPDVNMLAALERNVWHFSAAKNYTELVSLSQLLKDSDGKLRTFEAFKTEAVQVVDKFVNQWLKAEYELAVAGSQMAGKWQQIVENKETLPLLEFDAVLDQRTTEVCKGLDGTKLPVDHPFWKLYYPPNHFGCRSTVRQLRSGVETTADKIPSADIPEMFRTNLGEQRLVFPPNHPYFNGLPTEVTQAADKLMNERNG